MRKSSFRQFVSLLLTSCLLTGCATNPKLSYLGDSDLEYYRSDSERIDYPELSSASETPETVAFANAPRNVRDRNHDPKWEMPLAEAIHLALLHNKIVRTSSRTGTGAIGSGGAGGTSSSTIVRSPEAAGSIYDVPIQGSGVLFGSRGVEAALAEFDTQFTTSMVWGRDEKVQNNLFFAGGLQDGAILKTDTANMQAELRKANADGGQISLTHQVDYLYSNSPGNLFPSVYTGNFQLGYRRPLWAGSGAEFTRIAGPASQNIQGLSGVTQGVVIARINNDITIADFQMQVRNMIKDVEDVYWNLYLAYRRYDAEVIARNSAMRTWREVKARYDVGTEGGTAAEESQAQEQYFAAKARSEIELNNIYSMERELRRMTGQSVNDGRIIRPSDKPMTAEFQPDWFVALSEALTRRTELRRQKWNIKSLELQLIAAENVANPRLDFVSTYRVNMFGDNLFSDHDNDRAGTAQGLNSSYEKLTQGDQTGWQLGFQFSMPLGLRSAMAQVRNIELRLAKSRALLVSLEMDISHELGDAFQSLNVNYVTAQTRFNQSRAAQRQLEAREAEYEAGTKTLDLLLQAQARLARARIDYYTSVIEYTKSVTNIQFRKGTLLDYNNVNVAEGAWTPDAYEEALRRAWARSYAIDADNNKHTEPAPFVNSGGVMGNMNFVPADSNWSPGEGSNMDGSSLNDSPMGNQPGVVPPAPGADEIDLNEAPGGTLLPGSPQEKDYDADATSSLELGIPEEFADDNPSEELFEDAEFSDEDF